MKSGQEYPTGEHAGVNERCSNRLVNKSPYRMRPSPEPTFDHHLILKRRSHSSQPDTSLNAPQLVEEQSDAHDEAEYSKKNDQLDIPPLAGICFSHPCQQK